MGCFLWEAAFLFFGIEVFIGLQQLLCEKRNERKLIWTP